MRSEGERFYLVQELRFSPLFSGSSGNAIYVGCGNTHLLVDAGLSGARIRNIFQNLISNRIEQVSLSKTRSSIDEKRIIGQS